MDVGFIGLGNMGTAMARSLLQAGHKVTVYNRTRSKAEALAGQGARVAANIADACHGEVVLSMLADDHAVEGVVCGEGGVLHSLAEERIHISMSTISVALSERLTGLHGEKRQTYATATVFGRPEAAAAGKLFVVAAGPAQAIEKCQTLFDAMGQKTFVVSEKAADANLVKLSGNFLIAATIESLGEAIALVRKSGNRRASLCRNSDRQPLLGTGLQYLWRDHRWRKLRPGGIQNGPGSQGHKTRPGRRRDFECAVAHREPGP